jgi:rhamnose transport system ATP-binding protein
VLSVRGLGCAASAVHDVDLDLCAGEIIGLAGLVGAGRTELARILFGVTPADAGEIRLRGRSLTVHTPRIAVREGIAYLPEDRRRHGVIGEMSVAANLTLAIHDRLFPAGWLRKDAERQTADRWIRELDVKTPDRDTVANSLSGGNQQKVALARWLATEPRILILDEPTQGVDIGAKSEIHRIILRLAAEGLAVLLISSDLPEVLAMSTRVAVMRGGTIVARFGRGADSHEVMAAALGHNSRRP